VNTRGVASLRHAPIMNRLYVSGARKVGNEACRRPRSHSRKGGLDQASRQHLRTPLWRNQGARVFSADAGIEEMLD